MSGEEWTPAMVAAAGRESLSVDVDAFALGYIDEAVYQSETELRREFDRRAIHVGPGHRNLTWKFDLRAREFLGECAHAFFALHEDLLAWWRSPYAGAQLWLMSNGMADTRLLELHLSGSGEFFSTPVAAHYEEHGMREAYGRARTEFVVLACRTRGWQLYVNDDGRIDVRR